MSKIVALIPLRGGSKSIPDKNIRPIAGKPLCAWVLDAACGSGIFDQVVVSTDSQRISDVVHGLGLEVKIIERPPELATDLASTESVMQHAAQELFFDVLVTIQATSPLVTVDDFIAARQEFMSKHFDSLLTAVRVKRFFWQDDGTAINYQPLERPRRQDFNGTLMENGAFYFTKREILQQYGCRLGGRVGIYEMPPHAAIEIDEPDDWHVVERLLNMRNHEKFRQKMGDIKLLVVDVDGTLTDAGMYYSAEGEQLKKFNTRDAKGLELVRKSGIEVAFMTAENSPIVTARANKLGIGRCFVGVRDKWATLSALRSDLGVDLEQVAYIGDDVNDLACLKVAGFAACPSDAVTEVRAAVHYISPLNGGHGAVRDICELILGETS